MQQLHDKLIEQSEAYAKWHKHPSRHIAQWLLLLVVVVGVGYLLVNRANQPEYANYGNSSFAQSNNAGSVQDLTKQLLAAIKDYMQVKGSGDQAAEDAALAKVAGIAEQRKAALLDLIENNPALAVLNVLPPGLTKNFPDEIQALLEQDLDTQGTLEVSVQDNFQSHSSKNLFTLKTNGKSYNLHFATGEPKDLTGSVVKVHGTAIGNDVVLAEATSGGSGSYQTVSGATSVAATAAPHRTLVMLVNFSDNQSQPVTPAQAADMWFATSGDSVNTYYSEDTNGAISFAGDVTPQYITVPDSITTLCNSYSTIRAKVDTAAVNMGFVLSNYVHKVYIAIYPGGCSWAGISVIGGSSPTWSWATMQGGIANVEVSQHEIGHALGMHHASTPTSEYGDYWDVMGYYNEFHSNPGHKAALGVQAGTNIQTVSSSGTFILAPLESETLAVQSLKIAKPDTGTYYMVGYRQPVGRDVSLPSSFINGASIYTWSGTTGARTYLLNSGLADGGSFSDTINGITITQVYHSSTGTVVQIIKSAPVCGTASPTVSISPTTKQGSAGQSLSYSVSVKNNDSPACASTSFNLSAGLPQGWAGTFSPSSVTISPGGTGTTTFTITSAGTSADGSYTFTVNTAAQDGSHTGSVQASYVVFTDTTGPVVNIISPSNGAKIKGSSVTIQATASDISGVSRVEFYVDNSLLSTDTSAPYTYKWAINKVGAGTHTILVKAYDTAGNTGSSSISVTK